MAKKIFTYRGLTIEELQKLSLKELAELLPSRQRRCIKRGFSEDKLNFIKKVQKKDNVEAHLRDMLVLPSFVGKTIKIHDGKTFQPVIIQEDMIGLFLGELSTTRRRVQHNSPGVGASKSSAGTGKK